MFLSILKRPVLIAAFGAILVSFSEFWFYRVEEEVSSIGILLAYGLLGFLFLIILERFKVRDFAGFFVAAALLGYLIEGVPVPVMYAGPPLSIVWTSLAWHALLTVCVGWVGFKLVMAHGGLISVVFFNAALGAFLGLWNSYMWNAREDDATGALSFEWTSAELFAEQFVLGYALFIVGHLVFDWVWKPHEGLTRWEHYGLWVIAAVIAGGVAFASGLLVLLPILPVMVLICLWALRRNARRDLPRHDGIVAALAGKRIPIWRYVFTLLIPVCAITTYASLVDLQAGIEMNAWVILTAGPISLGLFLWGLWRTAFGPKHEAA